MSFLTFFEIMKSNRTTIIDYLQKYLSLERDRITHNNRRINSITSITLIEFHDYLRSLHSSTKTLTNFLTAANFSLPKVLTVTGETEALEALPLNISM